MIDANPDDLKARATQLRLALIDIIRHLTSVAVLTACLDVKQAIGTSNGKREKVGE